MSRDEVILLIARFRRSRDNCRRGFYCGTGSSYERGMATAFHLAAHRLYAAWKGR